MEGLKKSFLVKGNSIVGALGDKYFSNAPIGVIQAFSGNTVPHGYLLADGTSYKVADYPDLYAVIGNTYGGDSTNFNVPDYRETVLVGVGENTTDTIASHDVYELGEFKDDQLQEHKHDVSGVGYGASSGANWQYSTRQPKGDEYADNVVTTSNNISRTGTTTHSKQKGVTYIIKAFHTNEGVDSGVSDDVINYINNSLVDKADKNYVDDNFATMDNITQPIGFKTSLLNQCWGYYTKSGKTISVHMKFVLSSVLSDWQIINNTKLPTPSSVVTKSANGKTGVTNSVYIYTDGSMSQAGGGGMPAGTYEFDFDYTMA